MLLLLIVLLDENLAGKIQKKVGQIEKVFEK